ncbi:hypothetical protein NQZ68_008739 [Dissostichus eleginoides]|nr:hypothetical protein NQZ68_008739 [Dissostichus eleginoides]
MVWQRRSGPPVCSNIAAESGMCGRGFVLVVKRSTGPCLWQVQSPSKANHILVNTVAWLGLDKQLDYIGLQSTHQELNPGIDEGLLHRLQGTENVASVGCHINS